MIDWKKRLDFLQAQEWEKIINNMLREAKKEGFPSRGFLTIADVRKRKKFII